MLQMVRLVGVAALAPEVNAAKNLVRLQPGSDAFKAALATLQQINGCAPALTVPCAALKSSVCLAEAGSKLVTCSGAKQWANELIPDHIVCIVPGAARSGARCTHATAQAHRRTAPKT